MVTVPQSPEALKQARALRHRAACRVYYARHKARLKAARDDRRWEATPHDVRLLHCGQWHVIEALPWQCPGCGWVWAALPHKGGCDGNT